MSIGRYHYNGSKKNRMCRYGLDSTGSGKGPVAVGPSKYHNEPLSSVEGGKSN
jgi:hypothetical protein